MDKTVLEKQIASVWLEDQVKHFDPTGLVKIKEDALPRPDFFYKKDKILIEVSTVADGKSVRQSAQWAKIVNKLQEAVEKNEKSKTVDRLYLIETPDEFKTPTEDSFFLKSAGEIIDAVINKKKSVVIAGHSLKITGIKSKEGGIYFSSQGRGGSFDPAVTIFENISKKVRRSNEQLGFQDDKIKPTKRVLLLDNQYSLLTYDWDLYKAVSYLYKELLDFKNIDEVWLQVKLKDESIVSKLLYKRQLFQDFEKQSISNFTKEDAELFAHWFSPLSEKGEEKKQKLLDALKVFLKTQKPHEVFTDSYARIEMVRFGEWLVNSNMDSEALWLVDKFISDPNPPNPNDRGIDEEDLYYHNQVLQNKGDVFAITGVLGHLAWLVQKLALKKETLPQAFNYTKILAEHRNLYVKLQSLIPLIEVTKRRQFLEEYDVKNKTDLAVRFKELVFCLLENFSQYDAISKWLVHILNYYRDLTTKEALLVLNKLQNTSESAALFIIFGIFRKDYETKIPFDAEIVEKKLVDTILDKTPAYADLRSNIAWNFWKLLKDEPDKFEVVKKYIEILFQQPYSRGVYINLELILEDWIEKNPDDILEWFDLYLNSLFTYLESNKEEGRNIWITPEKMINKLAEENSDKLIRAMNKLLIIWKAGAYIGNINELFECFNKVEDGNEKDEVRNELKKIYSEMKELNPKLQEVNWG